MPKMTRRPSQPEQSQSLSAARSLISTDPAPEAGEPRWGRRGEKLSDPSKGTGECHMPSPDAARE